MKKQSLYIIRHGDRYDFMDPKAWPPPGEIGQARQFDPPLSDLGRSQAREVGAFLRQKLFTTDGETSEISNTKVLVSPFLRTIQTADEMISQFGRPPQEVKICLEHSISELDMKNGARHKALPSVFERVAYYPRIDTNYNSLFTPEMPEQYPDSFLDRCSRAIKELSIKYGQGFDKPSAIIVVTHAAGCIGMASRATGRSLSEVNAASPCCIFHLTRNIDDDSDISGVWEMDEWSLEGGMNGFTGHMTTLGEKTFPWNHFGPNGEYSGPPKKTM